MTKMQCLKTLETLLPLLLHPNRQIRLSVATYISILANSSDDVSLDQEESKSSNGRKIVVNRTPLFKKEEFYCFVRPKLLIYAKDQSDEMLDIHSANDVLNKLRPPLSLGTMREYFKLLSSGEDSVDVNAQKEEDF